MTTLAEQFQADVVRINGWFDLWNDKKKYEDDPTFTDLDELTNPANHTIKSELDPQLLTAPTLLPDNIEERVKAFINWGTFWTSVLSFYRRDFLIANQITFPAMIKSEDTTFVLECFLLAKKFLRVPNAVYIHRPRVGSITREDDSNFNIPKYIHKNICPLIECFNELEKSMDKFAFFKERPDYRYVVLDFFFRKQYSWLWQLQSMYAQIPTFKLNDIVKKEFSSDDAAFAAYLFNTVNIQRLQIMRLQQELAKFHQQ